MLRCWHAEPKSRPLFDVLEKDLAKFLPDEEVQRFIDLNKPHEEMNAEQFDNEQPDYLTQMDKPELALSTRGCDKMYVGSMSKLKSESTLNLVDNEFGFEGSVTSEFTV